MKNKNIIYKSLAAAFFMTVGFGSISCSGDYIGDVENIGAFNEDNYFKSEEQCLSATASVYDIMKKYAGGFENTVTFLNAGSDDFYAGGGSATDGAGIQGFNNYTITPITMPASYWRDYYQGVSRANWVLEKIPSAPVSDALKKRIMAEVTVLRSLYYFELVRLFGNIPLILKQINSNDDYWNIPQSPKQDIYNQIETDIVKVLGDLPMTVSGAENGRITQGNARAILGKIYLYDNKNTEAASQFAEVNGTPGQTSQYGYKLVPNFNTLWGLHPNSDGKLEYNKFTSESVLEAVYTNAGMSDWGFWGWGKDEGNSICIMTGPRSYNLSTGSNAPDLVSGWAFNTITDDLFNFMQNDPRADATILNVKKLQEEGKVTYSPAYSDTGYFLKKFAPYRAGVSPLPGAMELNFRPNYMVIRLSDTYLMEAEALGGSGSRAQALLDAVRSRVGLGSVPVSMQAIKDERRRELAGEGHRWFDLVRWGEAPSKLSSKGFVAGKNEILPIPYAETLNTALDQNPQY
jgi:hypothetical protein